MLCVCCTQCNATHTRASLSSENTCSHKSISTSFSVVCSDEDLEYPFYTGPQTLYDHYQQISEAFNCTNTGLSASPL